MKKAVKNLQSSCYVGVAEEDDKRFIKTAQVFFLDK